jgi:YebC/PmpR family DNA-binding regulatory protein
LTYRHVIYWRRPFTCTTISSSGHNRWSKIKHDKGKNDAAKNRQRSIFAQEIATTSRMSGPDPNSNPKLADLITKAKRDGMAKTSIEAAIARGQGRSTSGANLESVTVEGILPNNVAVIVECETDNRLRTLSEVRLVMKEAGGSATPCAYLFEKRGRIAFEKKEGTGLEEVLDAALEAGATDLEEDAEGSLVVFSEPGNTKAVGEAISRALGLETKTSEIIWYANEETKVNVPSVEAADELGGFVDELSEKESSVQSVAMNIAQGSLDSQSWEELMSRLS